MLRGFIFQPTYRMESGRPVVCLFGKLDSGRAFLLRDTRQVPHFHVRASDAGAARALGADVRDDPPPRRTLRGEPALRVDVRAPSDAPILRQKLASAGIATFEADVRFAYRYLIDRGIRASFRIADSEPGGTESAVATSGEGRGASGGPGADGLVTFENVEIEPDAWAPHLSVLSLDIETDPRARRILSVALAGDGVSEVLLVTPPGYGCPEGATPCATQRDLLHALVRRVREIDPDVLTGWNVVDFDLLVLRQVAGRVGVPLLLGRTREPLGLRPSRRARGGLEAMVTGRLVLDGLDLVRGAFLRFESLSLESVAREVLGERKLISGPDRAVEILRAFREDRPKLVAYNRADAELVLRVLGKLALVDLAVERSLLTGMPPDRVGASIASFDYLYLTELHRSGIVAPSVDAGMAQNWEPTAGGHVLDPVPGLYRNVMVFDFRSLYPSVIRTFHVDPLGYVPAPEPGVDPIVAPNGAAFRRERGILPALLDDLFERREAARRARNRVADQAIKILMNSFYGVLGTPACRFASPALANAITGFGKHVLLWSKAWIERSGRTVLYGDTDSLFVDSTLDDPAEARRVAVRLVEDLNAALARHVRERWRVESRLELQFETLYLRLLLPAMRHGSQGARKRYAGLVEVDGRRTVVFTGMEAVRRDWTALAKRTQRELYERLFTDRPVDDLLRDLVRDVRAGDLDDFLVYRKALRKELDAYTLSTPPHVAAARKQKGRGSRRGVIAYIMTTNGPEPIDRRRSPIDHEHYVQKQIRPVAEPVLGVLGLDFDRVVGDDTQMTLF